VRAWIASLDLGTVIGVCFRVWRVPGGHVQVIGHAVLMLFVLVASEAVHVPRHGRRKCRQEGHGEETGEDALHCPQSTGSRGVGQSRPKTSAA
jgi:hypothetical protein